MVDVGAVRKGVGERLGCRLLVAFRGVVLLRRRDLVPVLDEAHLVVKQPHVAAFEIVQSHRRAIHPELESRSLRRLLDIRRLQRLTNAGEQVALSASPRCVDAARDDHRLRDLGRVGHGGGDAGRQGRDGTTRRDYDRRRSGRDGDLVARCARLLQLGDRGDGVRKSDDGTVIADQSVRRNIQKHRVISTGRKLPVARDIEVPGHRSCARGIHAHQLLCRNARRDDGPAGGDNRARAGTQLGGGGTRRIEGESVAHVDRPERAGRRQDREGRAAQRDARTCRNRCGFDQGRIRGIDPRDAPLCCLDEEYTLAVLHHVEVVRLAADRPAQLLDLTVQPSAEQSSAVRHPHVLRVELHIRLRVAVMQHRETDRNGSDHGDRDPRGDRFPVAGEGRNEAHPATIIRRYTPREDHRSRPRARSRR